MDQHAGADAPHTLADTAFPHVRADDRARTQELRARAVDWAEIQERMLVPLYEAVYQRLDVGPGTRLLGLGCGSGLALLMAAARGATVAGTDPDDRRLALARERLARGRPTGAPGGAPPGGARAERGAGGAHGAWSDREQPGSASVRLAAGPPAGVRAPDSAPFTLVTAFDLAVMSGTATAVEALGEAVALAAPGSAVVLAGWGPPERCTTSTVLRVAARLADPAYSPGHGQPSPGVPPMPQGLWGRDDLEILAQRAGLRPDGSGRVACPFGYADVASAVRGLLSTGLFDAAERATDPAQVRKEVTEAVYPHRRPDGTVWMPNVFRYVIARTS